MNTLKTSTEKLEENPLMGDISPARTSWSDDEEIKERMKDRRLRQVFTSPHLYYLVVIFLVLGLYIGQTTSLWRSPARLPSRPTPYIEPNCGSSPAEAAHLGCKWDFYATLWMPEECYDRETTAMTESNDTLLYPLGGGLDSWPLFSDIEMTKPAAMHDLKVAAFINHKNHYNPDLNVKFYTDFRFHVAHCLHMWRLGVHLIDRQIQGQRNLGTFWKVTSKDHAWHCSDVIVTAENRKPWINDTVVPGVGRCVGVDDVWNEVHGGTE